MLEEVGVKQNWQINYSHLISCQFCFTPTSSSINFWYLYSHLISFVWSQDQLLTLLFLSSSFVFISHLTNFLSYSVFMFVACLFLSHFAFEKEPARFESKAINIYFAKNIKCSNLFYRANICGGGDYMYM